MRHTFTLDSIHKTYISQISLFTLRKNAQPQVKKALSGVSITLTPALYGLLGPNGAGKSTLMNVLSGVYPYGTYEGDILFDGNICKFQTIKQSEAIGISIIHQEIALAPNLSVAENVFLGNLKMLLPALVLKKAIRYWLAA